MFQKTCRRVTSSVSKPVSINAHIFLLWKHNKDKWKMIMCVAQDNNNADETAAARKLMEAGRTCLTKGGSTFSSSFHKVASARAGFYSKRSETSSDPLEVTFRTWVHETFSIQQHLKAKSPTA